MKITLIKTLGGRIIAAYDDDKAKLNKIKADTMFVADVTMPRNIKFHKKYFALLNLVFQNQEVYKNLEDLRRDLTIEAGFYRERLNIYGEVVKEVDSINFSSMDDLKFSELYDSTINVITAHFHFDKQSLIDEVSQYY